MLHFPAIGMRAWPLRWLLALACLLACAALAQGQTPTIVRVQQDWELVVGEPDQDSASPQVVCVLSPRGDVDWTYAAFELNHQNVPDFVPGGMQLQVWRGTRAVVQKQFSSNAQLATPGETITWTQSMSLDDNRLTFAIADGHSTTWGNFGGTANLQATVFTRLTNLNAYDPAVSVRNSGVGFANNRVRSLTLKCSRLTTSQNEELQDTTPRVIYAQPQQ
jgi:hypothetical protein